MSLELLKTHYDFLLIPNPFTADIYEHLPTLYKYALECEHITEMGFRTGTSFTAFLLAQPKTLISYDIHFPNHAGDFFDKLKNKTEIHLVKSSTLETEIVPTDLLFIDTLHTYDQLRQELKLHGKKAQKYIILHDVETFGEVGEDKRRPGLKLAVDEFLFDNPDWQIKEWFTNNNGLGILHKV